MKSTLIDLSSCLETLKYVDVSFLCKFLLYDFQSYTLLYCVSTKQNRILSCGFWQAFNLRLYFRGRSEIHNGHAYGKQVEVLSSCRFRCICNVKSGCLQQVGYGLCQTFRITCSRDVKNTSFNDSIYTSLARYLFHAQSYNSRKLLRR
jgi:hypothetical protein